MKMEEWVRPARMWAIQFFPTPWIDRHMKNFVQGKVLRLKQVESRSPSSPLDKGSEQALEASHSESSGVAGAVLVEPEVNNPRPMDVDVREEQTIRPKAVPSENRSRRRDRHWFSCAK